MLSKGINLYIAAAHANAIEKGFWDVIFRSDPEDDEIRDAVVASKIALVHSELSEALEGLRDDDMKNVAEEFADVCIRLFDLCGFLDIDLKRAIEEKMTKNAHRERLHGRRF